MKKNKRENQLAAKVLEIAWKQCKMDIVSRPSLANKYKRECTEKRLAKLNLTSESLLYRKAYVRVKKELIEKAKERLRSKKKMGNPLLRFFRLFQSFRLKEHAG